MSKEEIKYEINKVFDHLSDRALSELLAFLKKLDNNRETVPLHHFTVSLPKTRDYFPN